MGSQVGTLLHVSFLNLRGAYQVDLSRLGSVAQSSRIGAGPQFVLVPSGSIHSLAECPLKPPKPCGSDGCPGDSCVHPYPCFSLSFSLSPPLLPWHPLFASPGRPQL